MFYLGGMFKCELPFLDVLLGVVEHNSHAPEALVTQLKH